MSILFDERERISEIQERLPSWLAKVKPEWSNPSVQIDQVGGGNGLSNETYFVHVKWDGGARDLVLRAPPGDLDKSLFPTYNLAQQFYVMRALGESGKVPVPHCIALEEDASIIGSPFYIMDKVEGKVAPDATCYLNTGFLVDLTEEERRKLWWNGVDTLVNLSQVDVDRPAFDLLRVEGSHPSYERMEIDKNWELYKWGRGFEPHKDHAEIHQWLLDNEPDNLSVGLVWGDSRLGNFMFDGPKTTALLDWELVRLGDPRADIAYYALYDEVTKRDNVDQEQIVKFPGADETLQYYIDKTGCDPNDFNFFWVLSGFRLMSMVQKLFDLYASVGMIPADEVRDQKNLVGTKVVEVTQSRMS